MRKDNFTREMILRANEDMIQRKEMDTSRLPRSVVDIIKSTRVSADEVNAAYAETLKRRA